MEARCWSTEPSDIRRGGLHAPDGRTRLGIGAKPQTGPAPVPIWPPDRTTQDTAASEIPHRQARPWGKRGPPKAGWHMDNVERSFAAATAAGFVVLVVGIALLALL